MEPRRSIYPDLALAHRVREPSTGVIDPPVIYTAPPEEIREGYVEIRSVGRNGEAVTVIELLSLANKMPGRGREEYLRKQDDLLRSDIHLLEIDLLRTGQPTLAVPTVQEPVRQYLVSLHRGDGGWRFETWAFGLRDRLPRVAVPLTPDQPDVALDLQAVLDAVYDGGRYDQTVDYVEPPDPPLLPEDAAWFRSLMESR